MQQKLITFAVPCYNSAAYMRHCIETLLSAARHSAQIVRHSKTVKKIPSLLVGGGILLHNTPFYCVRAL